VQYAIANQKSEKMGCCWNFVMSDFSLAMQKVFLQGGGKVATTLSVVPGY